MRRLVSVAAMFTLLALLLPTLACAAASKATRMEQGCCRQMRGPCGAMAKGGCCQVELRSDLNQLPAQVVVAPVLPVTTLEALYPLLVVDLPASAAFRWQVPEEYSPPGLLIASASVLRI